MTKPLVQSAAEELRQQFSLLSQQYPQLIYFDSAATTQKPDAVIAVCSTFYKQQNANVHRGAYQLANRTTTQFEAVRKQVQGFINARSEREIVFTKGVTEGVNLLAHGLGINQCKVGQDIVISTLEHHANIVPWQQLAQRLGLNLKIIPTNNNAVLDLSNIDELITDNTAIVAVGHVSNAFGNINPIEALITKAKEVGAISIIDGAQAVGHMAVDVQQLDCDFYIFSGHKMFAPTGVGVLYGKYALLNSLPPYQLGGEMINSVSFEQSTFRDAPLKFEAGTPNIQGVIGLGAAITWMQKYFTQECMDAEQALYRQLLSELQAMPEVIIYGDNEHSVPILSLTFAGHNVLDIAELLNQQQIAVRVGHHCAMPAMQALNIDGTLRVSLAAYNTQNEVQRFIQALKRALHTSATGLTSESLPSSQSPQDLSTLGAEIKGAKSWEQKYRQIMLAGKYLERLPISEQITANQVNGCESPVWLMITKNADKFHFQADSTSKIVRGLLAIILDAIEGRTADFIQQFYLETYLTDIGLATHLSQSRSNGLQAVWQKIQQTTANFK
ncbi:SufS family cysteine desulfurase [Alteromonadaceae bacterium BrNp21-10]|nr:SufS family cysteine desulfurase [Alteromonadaceae bacterium BrNp21-10]